MKIVWVSVNTSMILPIPCGLWKDAIELVKYAGKRGGSVAPLLEDSSTGLRIIEVTNFQSYFSN